MGAVALGVLDDCSLALWAIGIVAPRCRLRAGLWIEERMAVPGIGRVKQLARTDLVQPGSTGQADLLGAEPSAVAMPVSSKLVGSKDALTVLFRRMVHAEDWIVAHHERTREDSLLGKANVMSGGAN